MIDAIWSKATWMNGGVSVSIAGRMPAVAALIRSVR
jgi:hypothetical protein